MKILFKSPGTRFACRSALAKQINWIPNPLGEASGHQIPAYKILHAIYKRLHATYHRLFPIYRRLNACYIQLQTTYSRLNAIYDALSATFRHPNAAYRALDTTCDQLNPTYHRLYPCCSHLKRIYCHLMAICQSIDLTAFRQRNKHYSRYQDLILLNLNPAYVCAISFAHMVPGKSRDLFFTTKSFLL